ncbi:FluC/FEX family fluoride channel [Candidatus Poriferisodalis sp.]|uniref:FluC/FEX family fluoride channel n=1 Tax=Candidatus Poriferisodalis sp. TaxID=3101277 RepID=UPI003B017916
MSLRVAATVAAAGIVGAAARSGVATQVDDDWALLIVNVVGCGIVGWATARHAQARHRRAVRPGIGSAGRSGAGPSPGLTAGFCGALTSMSALALQLARYLDDGRIAMAGAWLGLTAVACTAAFVMSRLAVVLAYGRQP